MSRSDLPEPGPAAPGSRPVVLAVQNDATCPPALVGEWLMEDGLDVRTIHAYAGESVPTVVPDDVHAVLPLGGTPGAHDDHDAPWLPQERALLGDAVDRGVPVLGLCLGGQLLAASTGGTVTVSDIAEIGVSEVYRTLDGLADPVISATRPIGGDTVPAAQWHVDHIAELPDGGVLLMTNDACRVQAFRLGETAYGLQMHPEIDLQIYTDWVADSDEVVPRSAVTASESLEVFRSRERDLIEAWRPAVRAWGELVWLRARALDNLTES